MSLRPPPAKSPSRRRAIFAVLVLVSGVAGAADRAFLASNSTGSPLGRWVNVGTKNLTIHGTAYTVPCDSSSTGIAWSPHGVSIGTALDFNYGTNDLVWTSITGSNADTTAADAQNVAPCGASAGKKCIGVATYDVSSNTLSRYFHPTFDETGATNPDVLGYGVRAVAINKAGGADSPAGSIKSWNTSGSGTAESMASGHTSQLEWVDGRYFVATAPDKSSCASNSPELQLWDATLTTGTKQASIVMPNGTDKPEGVDVVAINSGNRGSCGANADYAVYVSDFCNDNLYVYALDLNGASSTFTLKRTVNLNTGSSFAGACQPSAVRYYGLSQKAFVVCQIRETIQRIDAADLCAPDTSFESEADLMFAGSTSTASCGGTPSISGCSADSNVDCSPHDIDIDNDIATGWLFVNLTGANQSVAVRRSVLTDQATFFKQNTNNIVPFEMSLGSTP